MITQKNKDGSRRIIYTRDEYSDLIIKKIEDDLTELIIRLMGEVGLRVGVLNGIKYADVHRTDNDFLLSVNNAKDTSGEYEGGKQRTVFLADNVERCMYEYMHENNLNPEAELIDLSKRAIQYRVEKLREKIVNETDDERWTYLSAHDFRASFTNYLLHETDAKPSVVKHQMGWDSWETMQHYEAQPNESVLIEEFEGL